LSINVSAPVANSVGVSGRPRPDTVTVSTASRAVTNVGMGAVAAVALAADTRTWYVALILGDAVTFLASAALLLRIPLPRHQAATPATPTASLGGSGGLVRRPW
jgi:hypothetical protein